MKNILVAVALAATIVTVQADAVSDLACSTAKTGLDLANSSGVQTAIDTAKKTVTQACGAEALIGSLASVAVAIYALTF